MKKITKEKTLWLINVFILLLYTIDIGGFPNRIAILWIAFSGFYCIIKKTILKPDIKTILLTIGMLSHAAIFKYYYPTWSTTLTVSLGVIPILFYLLGRQAIGRVSKDNLYEYKAEILVIIIVFGMFIHAVLNFYAWTQGHTGKYWDDFWPDLLCQISTQHSFLVVGTVSLIAYGIYYITKKWYYSILIFLLVLSANVINIIYDNRMVLVITIVLLGMNFFIYLYLNRKSKRALRICIGTGLFVMVCMILIIGLNIGKIRETSYFQRFVSRDGGILNNIRFKAHRKAISQLLSHWRGGGTMDFLGLNHAHNFWLEMANETGLVSFVPTVLFTLSALIDMIKLILNKNISDKLKYLLPSVFMGIVLYHFVEIGGVTRPDYFLYITVMAGIICQTLKCAENKGHMA